MQFSEVSELNWSIRMLRSGASNSPTFHDQHDSEIDRLFNGSPPASMGSDGRVWSIPADGSNNTGQIAVSGANGVQSTAYGNGSNGNSTRGNNKPKVDEKDDSTKDEKKGGNGRRNSVRKGGVRTVVFKVAEKYTRRKERDYDDDLSDSAVETDKEDDETYRFVKEEDFRSVKPATSELAQLLKGNKVKPGGKLPVAHGPDSAMLKLTIYLPTREEMAVELYEVSTVEEAIEAILQIHREETRQPVLYYGHPECYELRLHDSDGLPDEDFPALDRSRKIKNFGDAGGHEYCLCERPDVCPPLEETAASMAAGGAKQRTANRQNANANANANAGQSIKATMMENTKAHQAQSVERKNPTLTSQTAVLKINMPNSDYAVLAIDSETTGQDLLPILSKKHRVQLFLEDQILVISQADQERLGFSTREVSLQTKLYPLGLQEVTLTKKAYADTPNRKKEPEETRAKRAVNNTLANSPYKSPSSSASINSKEPRPPPETFMFNDITAFMYKEWEVVKKNKYGKKQNRMFGLDKEKVYNSKVGERAIKSRTAIKKAERSIASIQRIGFLDNSCEFFIYYNKPEPITIEYRAMTPYDCAEIVARLQYILSRTRKEP